MDYLVNDISGWHNLVSSYNLMFIANNQGSVQYQLIHQGRDKMADIFKFSSIELVEFRLKLQFDLHDTID